MQPLFKDIYDDYSKMVYNLCLHYLQNKEVAEEATQDVFVKIHQKLGSWKGDAGLKTWIYRITVNHCLDEIKAANRKKRSHLIFPLFNNADEVVYEPADFNHPGIQLEHKEALKELFTLINSLPPNQKTALILSRLEELGQREIAQVMAITEGSVESLLYRSKENLRRKLNQNR